MMSQVNQKAILLIVALLAGKYTRSDEGIFYLIGGIVLFWALHQQYTILSYFKGLYTPAPRNAVYKAAPLMYLYDPETNSMQGISRALVTQLLEARNRFE